MWKTHHGLLLCRSGEQSAAYKHELGGGNQNGGKEPNCRFTQVLMVALLHFSKNSYGVLQLDPAQADIWSHETACFFLWTTDFKRKNIFFFQAKPCGKTSCTTSHRSSFITFPNICSMWQPSLYMTLLPARDFSKNDLINAKAPLFLNSK